VLYLTGKGKTTTGLRIDRKL